MYMKGEKTMGSTGAGRGAAGGAATGTASRPAPNGLRTARGRRRAAAEGRSGAVSTEDFIRATGVNPRTGRRVRRRG